MRPNAWALLPKAKVFPRPNGTAHPDLLTVAGGTISRGRFIRDYPGTKRVPDIDSEAWAASTAMRDTWTRNYAATGDSGRDASLGLQATGKSSYANLDDSVPAAAAPTHVDCSIDCRNSKFACCSRYDHNASNNFFNLTLRSVTPLDL